MSAHVRRGWSDRARARAEEAKRARQLAVERPVLDTIRTLRAQGRSWRAIATCLEERFDPPGRRGNWVAGPWTHKSVLRIARRHGIAPDAAAETPDPAQAPTPHPGAPEESGAPLAGPTLADLAPGETLCARCPHCDRERALALDVLIKRFGEHAELEQVRRRLRCSACDLRNVLLLRKPGAPRCVF